MSIDNLTDEQLIEGLKAYRPPKKLHPIAGKTYDLYAAAGNQLSDEAIAELRKDLEATYGDLKATTDALCGLASFVVYANEHLKDPKAGDQISALMQETRSQFEPLAARLSTLLQDAAKYATGVLDRFMDRDQTAKNRAPRYDEPAPEGTVPLKQLKPVAQPPPVRDRGKKK